MSPSAPAVTASATISAATDQKLGRIPVDRSGKKLYHVVTDHNPGDATGQDVTNFGAAWYVVGPDGKRVED